MFVRALVVCLAVARCGALKTPTQWTADRRNVALLLEPTTEMPLWPHSSSLVALCESLTLRETRPSWLFLLPIGSGRTFVMRRYDRAAEGWRVTRSADLESCLAAAFELAERQDEDEYKLLTPLASFQVIFADDGAVTLKGLASDPAVDLLDDGARDAVLAALGLEREAALYYALSEESKTVLLELSPAAFEGLLARDDLQLTELLARIGARRVVATTDDGGRLRATTLRDALACELADSDAITCAVACCTQYWIARSACDQVELELLRRAPAPPVRLALSIEVKQPIINGKSQPPFFSITAELAPT